MPLVATERAVGSRGYLVRAYVALGTAALALLSYVTWARLDETRRVLGELGASAFPLVASLVAFAVILAFLRFPLSHEMFVNPAIAAYVAILPILGPVLSSWIAVLTAMAVRAISIAGFGPTKITTHDVTIEYYKLFALISTYGIPMMAAATVQGALGATYPLEESSLRSGGRIFVAGVVFIATNLLVMQPVHQGLAYSLWTRVRLSLVDSAIYIVALPYSILVAWCWVALGFRGVLPAMGTGVVAMVIVRSFAAARGANRALVQRLASLANIAAVVSIKSTPADLLRTIHAECSKVMDASLFSVAMLDEERRELRFELEMRDGAAVPAFAIPLGEGLNSWVVVNRKPLLLKNSREESIHGVRSVEDGVPTESWLGVPMIVQDRVIGVISIQSYRKNAFSGDDVFLLQAVASQAAAALEDSTLYRDLRDLNVALEDRVRERTSEIREINLRLLDADQAKTTFLANMSHELRTPLNSIIGFSNVLIEKTTGAIAPRLHGFLVNIRASGTHLLALIDDILDLSKVEAGKMELDLAPCDLRQLVESVEQVMRGVAGAAEVSVVSRVDPALPEAVIDRGRITQVLLNLVSNAVKFSPRNGMVTIAAESRGADVSALGCPSVRLQVEDQGVGIAAEELPKIFEQFYQVGATRTQVKGTGLGLPLARRLVELHTGTITVESTPGKGTRFIVDLPLDVATRIQRECERARS